MLYRSQCLIILVHSECIPEDASPVFSCISLWQIWSFLRYPCERVCYSLVLFLFLWYCFIQGLSILPLMKFSVLCKWCSMHHRHISSRRFVLCHKEFPQISTILDYLLGWVEFKNCFFIFVEPSKLVLFDKNQFFLLFSQKILYYSNMLKSKSKNLKLFRRQRDQPVKQWM